MTTAAAETTATETAAAGATAPDGAGKTGAAAAETGKTLQTVTTKTETGEPTGGEGKARESASGAPEKYEPFTVPDGSSLDEMLVGKFAPVAKELGLGQEAAQRLVDLYAEHVAGADKGLEGQIEAWAQKTAVEPNTADAVGPEDRVEHAWRLMRAPLVEAWAKQITADKELGGADHAQKLDVARQAVERFGNPAFRRILDHSGLGNHPEMFRFLLKIGQGLQEDKASAGSQTGAGGEKSEEQALRERYPKMHEQMRAS